MASTAPTSLVILHESFAVRMKQACDANPDVPPMNDGRLVWVRSKMADEGHDVSLQTVMRWYYGAAMPRQAKMVALSKVLGVSPSWLSLGRDEKYKVDTTSRNVNPEGAVNALVGHMQMAGVACAFPEEDDPRAASVHFYSIVRGRQLPIHVSTAMSDTKQGTVFFRIPAKHTRLVVMVVMPTGTKSIEVWHVPNETLEASAQNDSDTKVVSAKVNGNHLSVGRQKLTAIEDFAQLLNA